MITEVKIGDTVSIEGIHFVCSDVLVKLGAPPKVVFKHPSELVVKAEIE